MPPCIGLIGGLAVGANLRYYKRLAAEFARASTPLDLVLIHADLEIVDGYIRGRRADALAGYFTQAVARLSAAGATFAAVTSVASHLGFQQLAAQAQIPLLSILEAIRHEIEARKLQRVVLLGSSYAMQSAMYGALDGAVEVVRMSAEETAEVNRIYMELAHTGLSAEASERKLNGMAEEVIARERLDAVVLAGTDFSVMFDEHRPEFPYLDATDAHVRALTRRFLAEAEQQARPGR